jgi:rhamnogalacturonyl hydrolase YesR
MAAGYITLHDMTGRAEYRARALDCLEWLIQHKSARYPQYAWGNHYPYATRSGKLPQEEPIIVWTSLIGMAFLDAFEAFGDSKYLGVALSVCDWILHVPREKASTGVCLSYHAFQQTSIHNSNMLGAAMLARTSKVAQRDVGLDVARQAMAYSCAGQLPDGAWYYGESPKHRWVDNFHTGYNLDCLKCYVGSTGDRSFEDHIRRGFQFFKDNFFEANGRPKYYHNEVYPVDIQCASQAIESLALFAEDDPDSLELGMRVAEWTIQNMQDRDGHFYYRDLGWTKVKTPLNHWGQGTMFKALACLLAKVQTHRVPEPALAT